MNSNVLLEFCRNQTATIQSFVMGAAQSTVTVMLEAVKKWKEKLSDSEWKNSKAILQTIKVRKYVKSTLLKGPSQHFLVRSSQSDGTTSVPRHF